MRIFKRILMCTLTGVMLFAGAVCANAAEVVDEGTCGPTASWVLDSSGTLTIKGSGAVTSAPWYELDSEITSLVIGDGITDLGEYTSISTLKNVYISNLKQWLDIDIAFKEESGYSYSPMISAENMYINGTLAKDIVIPDGITEIKGTSFYGWDCLGSVTIPDSVKTIGWAAFAYCPRLSEVTFGNGLETIGNGAFEYAANLLSVVIPDSVKTIGARAFLECNSLEDLTIGNGVTSIGDYAFRVAGIKNLYIKDLTSYLNIDTKTPINMYVLFGSDETNNIYINGELATEIVIPDGVENIRDYAFFEWKTPQSITVPDSVKSIGTSAFESCGIKSIDLGNGVEQIKNNAFDRCGITSIEIPPSLKTVEAEAFSCTDLKDVYIIDLAAWLNIDFAGGSYGEWESTPMYYAENMYINGALASSVTVPEGIKEIKNLAFLGWDCLKNISIPESVTRIGYSAFRESGLTKVIIPDSVTELGGFAFDSCKSLTEASIGSGITTIKGGTFYQDFSLLRLAMSSSVTTVEMGAFYEGNIMAVYYDGDKSDWRYISFNENNDCLKNAVVLYGAEPFKEITAYSGKCGENLTWEITSHGNMTISGNGAMTDGELPWKDCFSNIYNSSYYPQCTITVKEGVTSLSEEFDAYCYSYHVKCIYLPKSLVNINFLSNFGSDTEIYYSGTEEQWKAYEFGSIDYYSNVHFNSLPPAPPLEVSVTHTTTDNAVQFTVSVSDAERIDEIKDVKLYVAEYDENGILTNIREGVNGTADGGSIVITADKPASDKFKFMLWNDNLYPYMNAVTDI